MGEAELVKASAVPNGAWWTFSRVMMGLLTAGTIYGFGSWSPLFQDPEGYDLTSEQLEFMGTMAHAGNYIVIDAGIINTVMGTHVTFAYGCIWACLGYTCLWASYALANGKLPYAVLCLFCLMYGHGCGSIDNAAMTELLGAFPDHKGNVVGCLKGYYGLASAIITVVYFAVFQPSQDGFLIFLGVYAGVSGLVVTPIIRKCKGRIEEASSAVSTKFKMVIGGIVFFEIFILIVNIFKPQINDMKNNGKPLWLGILTVVVIGIGSLFLLPRGARGLDSAPLTRETEQVSAPPAMPEIRNVDVLGMMKCPDFWVLVIVLIIGQGSGLLFINNASQAVKAFKQDAHADQTSYIAMISCFNSFGRLVYGNLSQALLGRMSRMWFLVLSCALLSSAYWLLYLFGEPMLWPAGAIVGAAYGGLWGVQPVILTEIYGSKQYGVKYAFSAIAAFIGSLIFATALAGNLYDAEAKKFDDGKYCLKPQCFDEIYLITGCCGIAAVAIGVVLCGMTKRIYAEMRENMRAESA